MVKPVVSNERVTEQEKNNPVAKRNVINFFMFFSSNVGGMLNRFVKPVLIFVKTQLKNKKFEVEMLKTQKPSGL